MATASAADPPSPIARGMCGNTSMSIVRSSSASSRNSIARMPATPCGCSSTERIRCSTPQRGTSSRTPSVASRITNLDRQRNRRRDRVPTVNHRVFAEQDHFAVGEAAAFTFRHRLPMRDQRADEFLRFPDFDFAGFDQRFDDGVEQRFGHAGGGRDAARVQRHVALLNAVGRERAQRREVLREADGRHDRREFARIRRTEQPMIDAHRRIAFERAADGADLHRHFEFADEVAALVLIPARQRRVAAGARRVRVRRGLDRAPVVAGRERDGVDAVHDAFVVRRGAVRIDASRDRSRG